MNWIEAIALYWKELGLIVTPIVAWIAGRESKKIKDKTDEAGLTSIVQDIYRKLSVDIKSRVEDLEAANVDLTKKYGDMLIRNSVLEERATTYETKYKALEKDYVKLKSDHEKLHKENKDIRKELEGIKNGNK